MSGCKLLYANTVFLVKSSEVVKWFKNIVLRILSLINRKSSSSIFFSLQCSQNDIKEFDMCLKTKLAEEQKYKRSL